MPTTPPATTPGTGGGGTGSGGTGSGTGTGTSTLAETGSTAIVPTMLAGLLVLVGAILLAYRAGTGSNRGERRRNTPTT